MFTIERSKEPDKDWNNRLLKSKYGTIYQSTALSDYQKTTSNIDHEFLKFIDSSGEISAQILLSKNTRQGKIGKIKKFSKIPFVNNLFYKWTYGPIIFDESKSDEIIQNLQDFFLSKKIPVSGYFHPFTKFNKNSIKEKFLLKEWSTFLIDLSEDLNDLWKKMDKKSARKNIERSQERGVNVVEAKYDDLRDYFELVQNVKNQNDPNFKFDYIEATWNTLRKLGYTVFLAYKNNLPIGGLGISFFNSYVNEWGVGRSKLDYDEKLYSQDLIKWKVISWAKKNNCTYFDLSGASPNPKNEKEIGILRYKKKWGGMQTPLFLLKM